MRSTTKVGVYFGMPESEYRAINALSQSGIKNLLASPLDYWANSPMNPDLEEKDTPSKIEGRAVHKMIFENRRAFSRTFAVIPTPAQYPKALSGLADLKAYAREIKVYQPANSMMGLANQIAKVKEDHPPLFPHIEKEWKDKLRNRTPIKFEFYKELKRMAKRFRENPYVAQIMEQTQTEVSVVFMVGKIKCKARFDALAPGRIVDLKTYTNTNRDPLDDLIGKQIARFGYHIQGVFYTWAYEEAQRLISQRKIYGYKGDTDWLNAVSQTSPEYFLIFLSRGAATNIVIRQVVDKYGEDDSVVWYDALRKISNAMDTYARWKKSHGRRPWVMSEPPQALNDDNYPQWGLD